MKNARVLIVEDDDLWVETYRRVLAGQVASLTSVHTLDEATAMLDTRYFNVAIVDLRLVDSSDPRDISGMAFLAAVHQRGLEDVLAPIMCTAYGSMKSAVEALRDYQVVDFLPKDEFDAQSLLAAVAKALARQQCAGELDIEIEGALPLPALWAGREWAQRESADELEAELHDLFRRLFPRSDHLWMSPRKAGQSGAGVLAVEPTYGPTSGEMDIVKFGKRNKIRQELDNYAKYIDRYVGSQSSTKVEGVSGRVMGAIRYRLIGAGAKTDSLAVYYSKNNAAAVGEVLENLFGVTCKRWYDNREQPRRRRDLVALYTEGLHIEWEEVWTGAERCTIDVTRPLLEFPGVSGSFANPYNWLAERNNILSYPVWLAITHGDLNEHNVLVTPDQHTWLIDFYRTGSGHILRDVVELETAFKFALAERFSLRDRANMEELLLGQSELDAAVAVDPSVPYAKAAVVICHLRRLAGEVLGLDRGIEEYQVALLLQTLKLLSLDFLHHDDRSRAHVLLSAAMICTKLGTAS